MNRLEMVIINTIIFYNHLKKKLSFYFILKDEIPTKSFILMKNNINIYIYFIFML